MGEFWIQYYPKLLTMSISRNKLLLRSLLSIFSLLFIGQSVLAQDRKSFQVINDSTRSSLSLNVHHTFNSPSIFETYESYHTSGIGGSLIYDYLVFREPGIGLRAKLFVQRSTLLRARSQSSHPNHDVVASTDNNLSVFNMSLGIYVHDKVSKGLSFKASLYYGFALANMSGFKDIQLDEILLSDFSSTFSQSLEPSLDFLIRINEKVDLIIGASYFWSRFEFSDFSDNGQKQTIAFQNLNTNIGFQLSL